MATRSQPTTKPPGETIDGSHMAEQHFSTPGTPESTAVVSKAYLQRLEMENHLYRRHLSTFENAVAQKWVAILMKGIDEAVKETNGDTAVETDGNTAIEMNGDIAVK